MSKRVLILVSQRPARQEGMNWRGLSDWLQKLLDKNATVEISALDDLVYVAGKHSAIYDPNKMYDLADFDFVIMRTVGKEFERAVAAAHYLRAKNVPFTDSYLVAQGRGKLSCSFARVTNGLPVPQTVYARPHLLPKALLAAQLKYPLILKADLGKKGNDNYLISSESELKETLAATAERDVDMIAQEFIPNNGDYRILVLHGKPVFALFRKSSTGSHLNNTSKGGEAIQVAVEEVDKAILEASIQAAKIERLEVAGVDIVVSAKTNSHYFLEVNRAPQIPTGAFANEKMAAYANMIKEYLDTSGPANPDSLTVLGRAERIDIPAYALTSVPAKVDTGADSSSIWASRIKKTSKGLECVFFDKGSRFYTGETVLIPPSSYQLTRVANSFGQKELRYKIKLSIRIKGKLIRTTFTLSDRSLKKYPILLGRRMLQKKFLVDVSQGDPLKGEERQSTKQLQKDLKSITKDNV